MRAPHHNVVVIAPMIMKLGTGVKLDVFYTMVTKKFVTSPPPSLILQIVYIGMHVKFGNLSYNIFRSTEENLK